MDPVHQPSIQPNKAIGKVWVRVCTPTNILGEYAIDALGDIDGALTLAAANILRALEQEHTQLTLCYCYSGTTGECLQTVTTLMDNGQPVSLLSVGFVPIDHQSLARTKETSNETFSSQWSTIGDQRFLINVTNGGFPSIHENSVARTICQFAKRFELRLALLRILSNSGSAAHPLESRKTVVDGALILSDAPRTIARVEQLDEALQLLYDRQVQCRFHVYPDPSPQNQSTPLIEYLHRCFHHNTRAITVTTPARSQIVL